MFKLYLLVVAALIVALGPQTMKGQVVGGLNVESDERAESKLNYLVFLMLYGNHICSGAMISIKYFLTTAHCIKGKDISGLIAIVGTHDIERNGKIFHLKALEPYPTYVRRDPPDWVNDIGICKLEEDVELSDYIGIVTLPTNDEIQTDSEAVFFGAGYTGIREFCGVMCFEGPDSPIFQKLTMTIIPLNTCKAKLNRLGNHRVYESHICATAKRGCGTANGDSGGPLVQNGVIIGILSGSINPPAKGHPEIFMKVSAYMLWIKGIIFEKEE